MESLGIYAPFLVYRPQIARRAGDEGQAQIAAPPVVQKRFPRRLVQVDHPPFDFCRQRLGMRRKHPPRITVRIHQRQRIEKPREFVHSAVVDFRLQCLVLRVRILAVARQDHKPPVVAFDGDRPLVVRENNKRIEVVVFFRIAPFALHHNHIRRNHVFQFADDVQPLIRRTDFLEYRNQCKQQRCIEA